VPSRGSSRLAIISHTKMPGQESHTPCDGSNYASRDDTGIDEQEISLFHSDRPGKKCDRPSDLPFKGTFSSTATKLALADFEPSPSKPSKAKAILKPAKKQPAKKQPAKKKAKRSPPVARDSESSDSESDDE
jgi:hypothetical protein